jgi:hypothetical protein
MLNERPRDGVVHPYRPEEDEAGVLQLRSEVWGANHPHTDARFLSWLLRQNPVREGSGALTRQAGRVIAFAGLSPRMMFLNGKVIQAAHGLDLMVDPSLGGMLSGRCGLKVSAAWARFATDQGFSFGVVFPNENSFRLLTSGRLQWRVILEPHLCVRPLNGFSAPPNFLSRIPATAMRLGTAMLSKGIDLLQRWNITPAGRLVEFIEADERLDALWMRASHHLKTAFVRDRRYLNWRYFHHPIYRYRFLGWELEGRLAAFVVTTTRDILGLKSLLIVDALSESDDADLLSAIIRHAVRQGARDGLELCAAQSCKGHSLDRALSKSGFFTVPQKYNPKRFFLTGLVLSPEGNDALKPDGWYFTWGDMDVV